MAKNKEQYLIEKAYYEEGKKIEMEGATGNWAFNAFPSFDWGHCTYRVMEEKPVLKKDTYIGKQVILREDVTQQGIINFRDGKFYFTSVLPDSFTIDTLKETFYIEDEDF